MTCTFLVDTLVDLCRVPSAVPPGPQTFIEPDDPLLVDYVQRHLRPRFIELSAYDIIDLPLNQFAVKFGNSVGPCLALMAYTPTQHHNLMHDPWSGRIRIPFELGIDESCVFGQGVTQNKTHQACLIALAKWLISERADLPGTLLLCINNEGRSSHACSTEMLDALPVTPDLVIQLFPTGFGIAVGNRGRADVCIHVRGEATHSSAPPADGRVINVVAAVIQRLITLDAEVGRATHPRLGREQTVPYQIIFEPVAPHTLPSYGKITVDRRLLPGTHPDDAVSQLRDALSDVSPAGCDIDVEAGATMLPTLLSDEDLVKLKPLDAAVQQHFGTPARHVIHDGTFDAGGPASRGIPTVMFGVPEEGPMLGDDYVRLSAVRAEYAILQSTVTNFFSRTQL